MHPSTGEVHDMGRCYEFGVSIDPSSELAMVVSPEGGHCVCPSTGATCRGRFAGCAEIISQPGRIPPNAPEWSIGTRTDPTLASHAQATTPATHPAAPAPQPVAHQPVAGQQFVSAPPLQPVNSPPPPPIPVHAAPAFQSALAAAEDRSAVRTSEATLSELRESVALLVQEMSELKTRPAGATIEDLAEAVVILRQDTPLDTDAQGLRDLVEGIAASHEASDVAGQLTMLHESLTAVTSSIAAIADQQVELATSASLTTDVQEPLNKLGRAVIELKTTQNAAFESLRLAQAATSDTINGVREEIRELSDRHARELHALRQQFTEMRTKLEERESAAFNADDLASQLSSMQSELSRLTPEGADMVSATQLADTINTLRDAGAEDISAAHLVHALQTDVRSIRDEVRSVKGRVESLDPGGSFATAPATPYAQQV